MKKLWWAIFLFWVMKVSAGAATGPGLPKYFKPAPATVDHSKFEILKKDFKSPEEVTRACLSCHNKAGKQIHKSLHWTWTWKGKNNRLMGKAHVINNY
ncbi:hypothetical protein [Thermodesulfatator autotrophicus]|uniref:Cytochrome C n=1 Tax=Thermodesulfatator autotrophicus TaxID=1795632 RepID=A0A177EAJ2_9BACT|nr:hypothetical protein [Thermodesulfatator autotrophicus]OAG28756.1 hypothetical protein TH606_00390 [Thermodesulfatator autotrophicus]